MSTNGDIPAGDTEMTEGDGEEIVTMMDVLKEQQEFEDDANAVLGGSDEKECTYSQGYIKRQAIYACNTCCPEAKEDPTKRAGFCLACSLTCHENHDLIELYTKRNFRCDCGNPKFKSPCQFTPNKTDLNDENVYNQNFIGLYCICNKPYGDQESSIDDEMIQCIICEDWWHSSHLDAVVPALDQFSEMVCKLCMAKNDFLHDYSNLAVNVETGDVDVVKINGIDSMVTDEKLTNDTVTDEKLTNDTVTDEKLTNDTVTGEKLTNDTVTDEKLTNDTVTDDKSLNDTDTDAKLSNGIEDSADKIETTNATNETTTESINEASPTEKERKEPEKSDSEIINNTEDNSKENVKKPTDAPMETDETDRAAVVLPEIRSEDKPETKLSEDTSEASAEEVQETNDISDKTIEENCTRSEEKAASADDSGAKLESGTVENPPENTDQSITEFAETQCTESKDRNESSNNSDFPNEAENSSENIDTVESKVTEDSVAEKEDTDKENATPEIPKAENDSQSAENNPSNAENITDESESAKTSQDIEIDESENAKTPLDIEMNDIGTNDKLIDNTTNETDAAKLSQGEEMNGISKENEKISNDIPAPKDNTSQEDETENCDSKDDSTIKEPEGNDKRMPITENKRKMSTEDKDDISPKKAKLDSKCARPKDVIKVHKGATFWPATFRQKLCTCNDCITMYKDLSVLFLTDLEDTVFAYEALGKERTAGKPNQYEKGMEALSSLGRVQQIDALTEYNKMRDKLLIFLQSFKDKKEIVTEGDIRSFFAGMKPKKRTDGVYFCG